MRVGRDPFAFRLPNLKIWKLASFCWDYRKDSLPKWMEGATLNCFAHLKRKKCRGREEELNSIPFSYPHPFLKRLHTQSHVKVEKKKKKKKKEVEPNWIDISTFFKKISFSHDFATLINERERERNAICITQNKKRLVPIVKFNSKLNRVNCPNQVVFFVYQINKNWLFTSAIVYDSKKIHGWYERERESSG